MEKMVSEAIQRNEKLFALKFKGDLSWFRWAKDRKVYHYVEFQKYYGVTAYYAWLNADPVVKFDQSIYIPQFFYDTEEDD